MELNTEHNTDCKKRSNKHNSRIFAIASYIVLVLVVFGATIGFIRFLFPYIGIWFLNQNLDNGANLSAFQASDRYNVVNLTSSLVSASVTIIYVIFTAFIFYTTDKNTQQSAKAQKITYIERRLEKFYLPLKIVLNKSGFDKITSKEHSMFEYYLINQRSCEFIDDYKILFTFIYLAPNDVKSLLDEFLELLNSNPLLYKKLENVTLFTRHSDGKKEAFSGEFYGLIKEEGCGKKLERDAETISEKYGLIKNLVDSDIESLESELAELVNL